VADVYNLPGGLPAMDMTHRGDVIRCAVTESLTAAKVNAQINAYNTSPPVIDINTSIAEMGNVGSGFWTYRVAYRTLRNTPTGGGTPVEGDTAAFLLIPEKPIAGAPLVVFAHQSVGIAPKCAPTLVDLSAPASDQDFPINLYKLAGYGYTVIAPDYNGFSYGQAPGYFNAEDEAHAVLDATRAAANLLPSPPDKVVIVGHSQGGHAALSAQSYASNYGLKGTLVGVAVFAPLWTSMAIWAAATTDAAGLKTATDPYSIMYSMQYAYSAGALAGDPMGGLAVFQSAKQQAAKNLIVGGECYDVTALQTLGAKPSDFFDMNYVNNVGFACAATPIGSDCTKAPSTPAGDAPLWLSRWQKDRPPLDAKSAPILVWYGGKDTAVRPGFAECAREKFAKDVSVAGATTTIKYCFDASAGHRDLIRSVDADYVNQWIAARAGVGGEPTGACADFPSPWTDVSGTTGTGCETPPNDL
jgi:pimeloyl-ACP methyl ester carboxylesterase